VSEKGMEVREEVIDAREKASVVKAANPLHEHKQNQAQRRSMQHCT
jgi:hypothetical protein